MLQLGIMLPVVRQNRYPLPHLSTRIPKDLYDSTPGLSPLTVAPWFVLSRVLWSSDLPDDVRLSAITRFPQCQAEGHKFAPTHPGVDVLLQTQVKPQFNRSVTDRSKLLFFMFCSLILVEY